MSSSSVPLGASLVPSRLLRLGAVFAVLAAGAAATVAPPAAMAAPAGNVEVISRAWGTEGAAPFSLGKWGGSDRPFLAGFVSDNGLYAAFSWARGATTPSAPFTGADIPIYLRDIQANTTIEIASRGYNEATNIDRSNRYLSYISGATEESFNVLTSVYVYDAKTKRSTLASRATGASGAAAPDATGMVSGDGRSVVYSTPGGPGFEPGIYRRDLATSVTTRLGEGPTRSDGQPIAVITSVSDDGRTVAASNFDWGKADEGVVLSPRGRDVVGGTPFVSADGSTAAYLAPTGAGGVVELAALKTSTGAITKLGQPKAGIDGDFALGPASAVVGWVSPDGQEIGVMPRRSPFWFSSNDYVYSAQVFDRRSGAFRAAGPYADELTRLSSPVGNTTAISRNGRFATILSYGPSPFNVGPEARGLLIVDTHGWNGLPGGADLPSPNLYVERRGPWCEYGKPGIITNVKGLLAPKYLPKASSVRGVFRVGSQVVLDATVSGADGEGVVRVPQGTTSFTAEITVTFPGRGTAKDTYTIEVDPSIDCGS